MCKHDDLKVRKWQGASRVPLGYFGCYLQRPELVFSQ